MTQLYPGVRKRLPMRHRISPPQVGAGRSINQLSSDPQPRAYLAHAAFQHIAYAKLTSDLLDVYGLPFVGERRIARDHKQRVVARQCCNNVFYQSVGEILLLGVGAQIGKRKYGDRWFVGKRERGLWRVLRFAATSRGSGTFSFPHRSDKANAP